MGFYLQPAAGGRPLSYRFWRRLAEIENVLAIKVAPFNRYQTIDVVRALADAGRGDVALYTGNDDNIVADLATTFRVGTRAGAGPLRFAGGLLGQFAAWTQRAATLVAETRAATAGGASVPARLLALGTALTDANAAIFDFANGYRGCIAGIHE